MFVAGSVVEKSRRESSQRYGGWAAKGLRATFCLAMFDQGIHCQWVARQGEQEGKASINIFKKDPWK